MNVTTALRDHLDRTGESMRGLSLRSGLSAKCVADILNLPGLRPRRSTLDALARTTGVDLVACGDDPSLTYQCLIDRLRAAGQDRAARRIAWLVKAASWVPQTRHVCPQDVVDFLTGIAPATVNLTPESLATYKSEALGIVRTALGRQRKRGVADMSAPYVDLYERLKDAEVFGGWELGRLGAFLVFLDGQGIQPEDVTTDTLASYHAHRLDVSGKPEESCRKHVIELAHSLRRISLHETLSALGFTATDHPFGAYDGRYGIANAVVAPLMKEFDERVAPWARGEASRTGQSLKEFLQSLDAEAAAARPASDKVARMRAAKAKKARLPGQAAQERREARDDLLRRSGFLTKKQRWSSSTLEARRGYFVAMAKALAASTGEVPETIEELVDPDFVEMAVEAIHEANVRDDPSGYVVSILKAVRKVAIGYLVSPKDSIEGIDGLIWSYRVESRGISPRNRRKLKQFDASKIDGTIDLADSIVSDVNTKIDLRRRRHKAEHGTLPTKVDVIDAELARDVMAALAHHMLLSRAPRSANVIWARLDWISWRDGGARITVPAVAVKNLVAGDPDLHIDLSAGASRLLRTWLDAVRSRALREGDDQNPFLFPSQGEKAKLGTPYLGVLRRVTRLLKRHVGVNIHPHLYRHLVGWIWLKESPDNLPKVQRLLGHESIATTINYYAELEEQAVVDSWMRYLDPDKTDDTRRKADQMNHKKRAKRAG